MGHSRGPAGDLNGGRVVRTAHGRGFYLRGKVPIELGPGWYTVSATAFEGQVCAELNTEVEPNQTTVIDFVCE